MMHFSFVRTSCSSHCALYDDLYFHNFDSFRISGFSANVWDLPGDPFCPPAHTGCICCSSCSCAYGRLATLRACIKFLKVVMVNSACVCVCMEDQCTSWSHAGWLELPEPQQKEEIILHALPD